MAPKSRKKPVRSSTILTIEYAGARRKRKGKSSALTMAKAFTMMSKLAEYDIECDSEKHGPAKAINIQIRPLP